MPASATAVAVRTTSEPLETRANLIDPGKLEPAHMQAEVILNPLWEISSILAELEIQPRFVASYAYMDKEPAPGLLG